MKNYRSVLLNRSAEEIVLQAYSLTNRSTLYDFNPTIPVSRFAIIPAEKTIMKTFLLIDDDDVFNFLHSKLLKHAGIARQIFTASHGEHALRMILDSVERKTPLPDVLLLDLNMPVMDGFDFLKSFRALPLHATNNTKILVVTSSNNPADIERVRQLGIDCYLTKPVTIETLLKCLED